MSPALAHSHFLGMEFADATQPLIVAGMVGFARGDVWRVAMAAGLDELEYLAANPALRSRADLLLLACPAVHRAARLCRHRPPPLFSRDGLWRGFLAGMAGDGLALHVVCTDGRPVEAWAARLGLRRLSISVPPSGLAEDPAALERAVEVILHHRADATLLALPLPDAMLLAARMATLVGGRGLCLMLGQGLPALAGGGGRGTWRLARSVLWQGPRALRLVLRGAA